MIKRKLILFLLAFTTALSLIGGIAWLLGTRPNSLNHQSTIWSDETEPKPIIIAAQPNKSSQQATSGQPGNASTEGRSRGG